MNDPATILIVEDEAHIAHILSVWLERQGYRTLKVPNGARALDLLVEPGSIVDAIISDANMPVLDGIGLLRAVREDLKLSIPFMLLTARCDQSKLADVLAPYGAEIYPKPFMPSQIVLVIKQLLATAAAATE